MVYSRGGKEHSVKMTLQNTFGDVTVTTAEGILGARVVPLTEKERYEYRLRNGVKIEELNSWLPDWGKVISLLKSTIP